MKMMRLVIGICITVCFVGVALQAEDNPGTKTAIGESMTPKTKAFPKLTISERTEQPLLKAEKPWENMSLNVMNVIHDAQGWRMWYAAYDHTYKDDNDAFLCYATSEDGVHWKRPSLGLVEYGGNKNNNILIAGRAIGGLHGQNVFIDENAPEKERYRMVFVRGETLPGKEFGWYVHGATSADGLRWNVLPELLLPQNSDTQTVCFFDRDRYRLYARMWTGPGVFNGKRVVGYSESRTFGSFPDPVQILATDEQDSKDLQFYNSAITKLQDDLYVMFPSGFDTVTNLVSPFMAVSHDGKNFTRLDRKPILPLGKPGSFDSKSIYVSPNAVPGEKPNTWWVYYLGYNIGHDVDKPKYTGGFGRFLLTVEDSPKP